MFVERILPAARRRLVTIDAQSQLTDVAVLLGWTDASLVVVCDAGGLLAGVLTKTDVVRQMGRCLIGNCAISAASIMTRQVTSCQRDESLHDVWARMKQRGLKHIPVVERTGKPIGLINARDVMEALLGEVANEELLLKEYVMSVGYQ